MSALDKKVKALMEVIPRLDENEARRLLEKAGGSVNKASDMAFEGGDWSAAPAKKKPVKKEEKEAPAVVRRDDKKDRPRREFADRKPRVEDAKPEAKATVKATPSTIVVGSAKSKVETGISFADMIKRQKQPEPIVEVAPEPEPVVEVAAPVKEEVVAPAEVAVEEPTAAPVVEAAPKPKKEKKEPKKPKAAPLPQKYEAEIDRVLAVNLPTNIVEMASGAFTFTSEPGRAPTPPRQQQVQQVHHQQQQQLQQQVHQQQNDWHRQHQPAQRGWNQQQQQQQQGDYNNNRHFAGDWRQNRSDNNNMGYQNNRVNHQYNRQDNQYVMRPNQAQPQTNTQNFW